MAMEALEKLATEMTDRIAELEKENGSLKAQLATANEALTKKAAEDNAPKNVVPEEVADATVKALVKAGALLDSQVDESKRVFMTDAKLKDCGYQPEVGDDVQIEYNRFGRVARIYPID